MNAESSAWGRALAAIGIATNKSIATAEEVRSARERSGAPETAARPTQGRQVTPNATAPQTTPQSVQEDVKW
jgi:hypothetical protein